MEKKLTSKPVSGVLPSDYLNASFWQIAQRAEQGDEGADSVYHAVGEALTQWERLEIELAGLFGILVDSASHAASRAYGVIVSARGRNEALERAGEVYFELHHPEHHLAFKNILRAVAYAAARRNDVAHGIVVTYADRSVPGGGYYLVAAEYNSRKTDAFIDLNNDVYDPFAFARHRYALTSREIKEYRLRFATLSHVVAELSRKLSSSAIG